jgi:hypothetical protein
VRLVNRPRSAMAMRQGGACERDNRYGGYNGEYARSRSPAHDGSCCWQYWTLHLDLSRRTHYATIICYAARMNELAVDREAIAYHGKRLEYFTIACATLLWRMSADANVEQRAFCVKRNPKRVETGCPMEGLFHQT